MSGKLTNWHISGMYCPHCEKAILKAVSGLNGLTAAKAAVKMEAQDSVTDDDPMAKYYRKQ